MPTIVHTNSPGQNKMVITVEDPSQEQVTGLDARNMAQKKAEETLSRPGFSAQSGPYPVDSDGKCTPAVQLGETAVAAYRQDFTFQGGL